MLRVDQINQYRQQGYCVYPEFLSSAEVAALLADIETISAGVTVANPNSSRLEMEPGQGPEGTLVRRIYEPCTYYARFRALSESEKLLDVVEQLLGPNLTFHYSKINMKPPAIGSVAAVVRIAAVPHIESFKASPPTTVNQGEAVTLEPAPDVRALGNGDRGHAHW